MTDQIIMQWVKQTLTISLLCKHALQLQFRQQNGQDFAIASSDIVGYLYFVTKN